MFLDDDYTYDNIMKTCDDYARMADVQPVVTNTLGFDRYIVFIPVISMFVFFIVLFCIFNIQKEYDNGEIIFTYSTMNGRFYLAFKRNIMYTLIAVALSVIFNAVIIVVSGLMYGFPDFLVPIQSSMLFKNCVSSLSILEFVIISTLETGIGIAVLSLFANLLFNIIKNKYISIILVGAVLFAEYRLSVLTQNNSYKRFFANVNIFKIIDYSDYYRNYNNINLFGKAQPALKAMLLVTVMLYVVLLFASAVAYVHRYPLSKVRFGRIKNYIEVQLGKCIAHSGFVGLEFYKIFVRKNRLILIIVLLLVEIFLIKETRVEFPKRQQIMDEAYSQYGGSDWEAFENYVEGCRKTMADNVQKISELQNVVAEGEDKRQNSDAIRILQAEIRETEKLLEEYDSVISRRNEVEEQTGIRIYAMSDRGYNEIFGKNSVVREIGILLIILLIVMLIGSGYYMEEIQSGFISLLRCSKKGEKDIFNKKLCIISVVVILIILLLLGLDYIWLGQMYGFKYTDAPIVSIGFMESELTSRFAGIKIQQYLVIDIAFRILLYMTALMCTLICSMRFRTLFFVPLVFFLLALTGCLCLFAGVTVKVTMIVVLLIAYVVLVWSILCGKTIKLNKK